MIGNVLLQTIVIFFCLPSLEGGNYGPYKLIAKSMTRTIKTDETVVEERFRLYKHTLESVGFGGYIHIKQKIGPFLLKSEVKEWDNGGWKNLTMDHMKDPDCKQFIQILRPKLMEYNTGNLTITDDCYFNPGIYSVRELDINTELHKYIPLGFLGTYRSRIGFFVDDSELFGVIFETESVPLIQRKMKLFL